MAEVREMDEDKSEDSSEDEEGDELSADLFEKTLAYMRDNKIYSVGTFEGFWEHLFSMDLWTF